MTSPTRPIRSVTTAELYDGWANVYDTDGNILQAVDDYEIPLLLEHVFTSLSSSTIITVTELGCGTGRNTLKLLPPRSNPQVSQIHGLDLSPAMLSVASSRTASFLAILSSPKPNVFFQAFNALTSPIPPPLSHSADLVLSTLVLEHLPLKAFFETVKGLVKKGGLVLVTNMHAEMGRRGQAGFVDERGQKVRGESFNYEVGEVVDEGRRKGFEILDVKERGLESGDVKGEGGKEEGGLGLGVRGRKWIGCKVWFGVVMRLRDA
ncbi:hypothetical protein B7494_g7160 [Chlorociboria aeruginascens]|nr:hypothetical protein B7494_g7160 [Chlorociboria aeruginascens]